MAELPSRDNWAKCDGSYPRSSASASSGPQISRQNFFKTSSTALSLPPIGAYTHLNSSSVSANLQDRFHRQKPAADIVDDCLSEKHSASTERTVSDDRGDSPNSSAQLRSYDDYSDYSSNFAYTLPSSFHRSVSSPSSALTNFEGPTRCVSAPIPTSSFSLANGFFSPAFASTQASSRPIRPFRDFMRTTSRPYIPSSLRISTSSADLRSATPSPSKSQPAQVHPIAEAALSAPISLPSTLHPLEATFQVDERLTKSDTNLTNSTDFYEDDQIGIDENDLSGYGGENIATEESRSAIALSSSTSSDPLTCPIDDVYMQSELPSSIDELYALRSSQPSSPISSPLLLPTSDGLDEAYKSEELSATGLIVEDKDPMFASLTTETVLENPPSSSPSAEVPLTSSPGPVQFFSSSVASSQTSEQCNSAQVDDITQELPAVEASIAVIDQPDDQAPAPMSEDNFEMVLPPSSPQPFSSSPRPSSPFAENEVDSVNLPSVDTAIDTLQDDDGLQSGVPTDSRTSDQRRMDEDVSAVVLQSPVTEEKDTFQESFNAIEKSNNETAMAAEQVTSPRKRKTLESTMLVPQPKRITLMSHKEQRKTFATPFKSPLLPKTDSSEANSNVSKKEDDVERGPVTTNLENEVNVASKLPAQSHAHKPEVSSNIRTKRVAKQFKSPLGPESVSATQAASVRLTPTIQTLERKIQILRRAVKVKEEGEERTLTDLARKWTEAGREIAWEVWGIVKDMEVDGGAGSYGTDAQGDKRPFQETWGWSEQGDEKRRKVGEGSSWGWDEGANEEEKEGEEAVFMRVRETRDEEEEEAPQETLGTMLRKLGIDPETFGWNDEEGGFKDF